MPLLWYNPHMTTEQPTMTEPPTLARNTLLLSLGNIGSRVFGLLRESVMAAYFGASGEMSAFRVAAQVPTLLYDFLIGGMLSAALVPVLSEYARRDRREFVRLVALLATFFFCALTVLILALQMIAPWLVWLLAAGFRTTQPELLTVTLGLLRWSLPVAWVLGMTGLLTAALYALQRFTFPALATALFNLGIVLTAPLLAARLGVVSLVLGLLLGSLMQCGLLLWDLRRAGVALRWQVEGRHPALWKILRLYAPIAVGLVVSLLQVGLDRRLASGTGPQSIAWMANATTLQQLPLGLISVAIALAALPHLSQFHAAGQETEYRQTLGRGLRMVLLLIVPAAVVLWLLGTPITRLLFERGQFTPADTVRVVAALQIYVLGMLFAAIDFPLNYAFYARNNTLLPALIGVFSVAVYVAVALALLTPLGYRGLVWADTAKQGSHVLLMAILLYQRVGRLGTGMGRGLAAVLVAAGGMMLTMWLMVHWLTPLLPATWLGDLLLIGVAGGCSFAIYALLLFMLRVPELSVVLAKVRATFTRHS